MNSDRDARGAPRSRGPMRRGRKLRHALTLTWALLGTVFLQYAAVGGLLWMLGWMSGRARQPRYARKAGADRTEAAGTRDTHARAARHAPGQAPSVYEARERTQVEILKLERIKQLLGHREHASSGRSLIETHVAQLEDLLRDARIPQASSPPAIVREVDRRIAVLHRDEPSYRMCWAGD